MNFIYDKDEFFGTKKMVLTVCANNQQWLLLHKSRKWYVSRLDSSAQIRAKTNITQLLPEHINAVMNSLSDRGNTYLNVIKPKPVGLQDAEVVSALLNCTSTEALWLTYREGNASTLLIL
jgi:hypothetical protein